MKNYVRENVPLSRFGVLVAQLESIVASASQQAPEPLMCFDLLSDLISAIEEEPKESILLWQRKCEDALYSLLILGAKQPVRHLASITMARIIYKGDAISVYSRASSLQGFLSDGKRNEPHRVAGAAQCLGELYLHFGRRITSGLLETTIIVTKLMKFSEEFVRQGALYLLQNALEGSGGSAVSSAYTEAYRIVMRSGIVDKSFIVKIAAARCLKAFADIGGPGLGIGELDNSSSCCVKALEDPVSSVRDSFADALGSLLALGMSPEAQVQPRGKGPFPPAKKLEGGLQRHLSLAFTKASGARSKGIRVGLALSWVFFLQAIRLRYNHPDAELQDFALQVMDMLHGDASMDAHALACVLYILRVGITDQMTESNQREFLIFLGKQLQSPEASPSMKIAALRTLSYTLKTLGEVPTEFKEVLDNTVVAAVSHASQLVRIEASLTLRALAEVDPTCFGGLVSYSVTMITALRENVSFEKGSNLQYAIDSLHGQATVLAALVSVSPKLHLGYPSRLPRSVLEVSQKMLMESCRNPTAAKIENEIGWLLLSSLLACMPKEELEDQVFDILSFWAMLFTGNPEQEVKQTSDLASRISIWSAAVHALTAFIRCFVSSDAVNNGILLHPVLIYMSRALSYTSLLTAMELPDLKPALSIFIMRTLVAYQSLPDPMLYKNDHAQIIQLCTSPFRDAFGCEESSCLRSLLDKRDAWLGPWIPGRDWFEDELRSFEGGKEGLMPSIWEEEISSFPQPETVNKTMVNQMLLCFGVMFACQDRAGMLSLLGVLDQCLKVGKKQTWHSASVTNICVGLIAGFKALLSLRPQPLSLDILSSAQTIFLSILSEGDICASQRRAASEGLGLLTRLGNDIFAARLTRLLLSDLNGVTDSNYAGSIALALGCIHRSAGGMALSTLVPATVSSISLLAKSSLTNLQIWSLHGLLLTIEAAGLSYVSHVQGTLGLALDILLTEENGLVDLQQGVGRLVNAIVAVLGPELAAGSIFFSRCKSIVAEISSRQEASTMLETVRFTQQLVLFAPQAVSMHSHMQTLLPTLSSKQPTLRHLAVSTLRQLIEKDPISVINEQIEDDLFHMLDEETDSEIANMVRTTILGLLYASCPSCPSRWISICRHVVLAVSFRRNLNHNTNVKDDPSHAPDGDTMLSHGDDDENMVSTGHSFGPSIVITNRNKQLRYRTRVFAAECLSRLPCAVGKNQAHFDPILARNQATNGSGSGDWLVLCLQELISLAYQISTIQFENMQSVGVELLCAIVDKFAQVPDPELPGQLLMEQYQAQLISAVRTSLDTSSGPILLEEGLQLATKILTSGIIGGDQVAVKRIFSLISHPLNGVKDLYYPSFAEWVSYKIKIRLLAAHASLKCYTYALLRRQESEVPDEYLALLPLFSKSSSILGKYWIWVLTDYSYICLGLHLKKKWCPFLEGNPSPVIISKLHPILQESWPVILQAVALDAVPADFDGNICPPVVDISKKALLSGYSMVQLESKEYQFLWGFALFALFHGHNEASDGLKVLFSPSKSNAEGESSVEKLTLPSFKLHEIVLPMFRFLSSENFFSLGFLTVDGCTELLKIFSYYIYLDISWNSLAASVLAQIVQNCPESFFESEKFAYLAWELCFAFIYLAWDSINAISPEKSGWEDLLSSVFETSKILLRRYIPKKELLPVLLAFVSIGYKYVQKATTEFYFSPVSDFVNSSGPLLKKLIHDKSNICDDGISNIGRVLGTCVKIVVDSCKNCIEGIHLLENKRSDLHKLPQVKLAFFLEQIVLFAKLAHEILCIEEEMDIQPFCFSIFKCCSKLIGNVLTDPNTQTQATGLLVLKGLVQKGTDEDDKNFCMLFAGEHAADVFVLIQKSLKKPITKESVTVVSECLKFLLLLQSMSREGEFHRLSMNLILEAIVMIFFALEDSSSREVNELKNTAVRLVSHLAQIPSSAADFKDILLSMPAMHRQKLQGAIRASVTQEHNPTPSKITTPSLEIKLPVPAQNIGKTPIPFENVSPEESEEEEDDWDAFQSFPTAVNATESEPVPNEMDDSTTYGSMNHNPMPQATNEMEINNNSPDLENSPLKDQMCDSKEVEEAHDIAKNHCGEDAEVLEKEDSSEHDSRKGTLGNKPDPDRSDDETDI